MGNNYPTACQMIEYDWFLLLDSINHSQLLGELRLTASPSLNQLERHWLREKAVSGI